MPKNRIVKRKRKRVSPGKKKVLLKKRRGEIKQRKKKGKVTFDIERLTRPIVAEADAPSQTSAPFSELGLDSRILKNVLDKGFERATPIQTLTIPPLLEGRDVVGIANTGTGKTAAFLLPLLHRTLKKREMRTLVLVPTRELGEQIMREFRVFGRGLDLHAALCIGGKFLRDQERELKKNPHFVVGTPGRLLDLIDRRILDLGGFHTLVVDEVDRMLDLGFLADVKGMLLQIPKPRHLMFFSATMPKVISDLTNTFLHNPLRFETRGRATAGSVDQSVIRLTKRDDPIEKLHELLLSKDVEKVLVFTNRKRTADKLYKELIARGFKAEAIHGDKLQSARSRALKRFAREEVPILVATNVAARGLDIPNVSHVINFDIPESYDDYVHRVGRTGRGGKEGKAITFIPHDFK